MAHFLGHKFHVVNTKILYLIPSCDLIKSIQQCVDEDKLNKLPHCNDECIDEVIVWNELYCIEFPLSYGWVDSVSKEFFKRLESHSLQCLLNSTVNLCNATTTNISLTVFRNFCMKLIQIAEESQTPLNDHELIVLSLLEVPKHKYSIITDVLAKILVLHRSDILGTNLVEHILSVSWYPALLRHCNIELLKHSGFPEAEVLLTSCMETVLKLDSGFHKLALSVNHLELVIKYRTTYLLLLKSLPVVSRISAKAMGESTFNSVFS